jgi:hypothetical protein
MAVAVASESNGRREAMEIASNLQSKKNEQKKDNQ